MERCAIVGSGLAALTAYATLRHGGLEPGEIAVFGTDADPAAVWRRRAAAIRQTHMRSESDGHPYPTTFPGLAAREAVRRRDLLLPLLSLLDRYRPTVDEFLAHVDRVRERSGWDGSLHQVRIARIAAVDGGFELDGEVDPGDVEPWSPPAIAMRMLNNLVRTFHRRGDLTDAIHAAGMRLALPADDDTRELFERELRTLRSQLN